MINNPVESKKASNQQNTLPLSSESFNKQLFFILLRLGRLHR